MKRLESQQVESLTGERSTRYEVILWGAMESEVVDCDSFLEECDAGFVVDTELYKVCISTNNQTLLFFVICNRGKLIYSNE